MEFLLKSNIEICLIDFKKGRENQKSLGSTQFFISIWANTTIISPLSWVFSTACTTILFLKIQNTIYPNHPRVWHPSIIFTASANPAWKASECFLEASEIRVQFSAKTKSVFLTHDHLSAAACFQLPLGTFFEGFLQTPISAEIGICRGFWKRSSEDTEGPLYVDSALGRVICKLYASIGVGTLPGKVAEICFSMYAFITWESMAICAPSSNLHYSVRP